MTTINLGPLAINPITVDPGDVLSVVVSYTYTAGIDDDVNFSVQVGMTSFVGVWEGTVVGTITEHLPATLSTPVSKTTTIPILMPSSINIIVTGDTPLDLRVDAGDSHAIAPDVIILSSEYEPIGGGTLGDIGNMIILMMVMMMITMMMENTRDLYEPAGTPPRPKPVTEAVVKGVKTTGRAVKKVTEYFLAEEERE